MSHSSLRLALLASAVALGGCTVYVNNRPPTNQQQQQAQPARQPSRGIRRPTNAQRPTTTTPTGTQTGTTKPVVEPPRINGRTAFGNGSLGAFKGYAYVIPDTTTKLPDLSKMVPFATLLTDSFIVQRQEFSGGFPGVLAQEEWFAIRYEGAFDVPRDSPYTFKLVSDDGAILYIDGEKLVDNDGLHAPQEAAGTKTLKTGRHQLRLDYMQGKKGTVALTLSVGEGDAAPRPLVGVR
ncbi:PA14 domain-containing protein [Polyangium mundeleinium]|uniref:PA14 domain-containing protein n=1 Tax=Polyangium mundeleinium TaxID=2995306 RepID=A0ABT5EVN3_9BACT|nr:PA14 domain-containing protein [Polyangium mundeleinium]MDC0745879.1 PA14 domain-containing protein [Polyangium mundeleinium]